MKKSIFTLAFAFIALFGFNAAQAQNAHFQDVVFSNDGLTVTGKVAGLGNKSGSVEVIYVSQVSLTKECINPGGELVEDKTETQPLSGGRGVFYTPGRNGQITFTITLDTTPIDETIDFTPCPNSRWTQKLTSTVLQSLTFKTKSNATGEYFQ